MKTRFLKFALLAVFCVGAATTNAQTKLSDEAVKVIKELKQVDTKGLSADEAQTVMKVLNQIKRENTPSAQFSAPMFYQRGEDCTTKCPREELKVVATTVSVAEKPLFILDGKEISIEEFNRLNPNCVADLKLIKGKDAKKEYGDKGANGVLVITTEDCVNQKGLVIVYKGKEISQEEAEQLGVSVECIKASVESVKAYQQQTADAKRLRIAERRQYQATSQQPQVTGFMSVKRGNIDTKSFANKELALQVVEQCQVLIILDGFEISKDKFNSLDANTIESMELKQGESLKIAYGKKATDGVLFIKTKKDGSAKVKGSTPQANIEYVQVLTRADLKPVEPATAKKGDTQEGVVSGFTVVRGGDITTEPVANLDIAVKTVEKGNIIILFDGIEISQEKFKGLNPDDVEKIELRKGETMKVLYGEKGADGALFITSKKAAAKNEQRAARRANAQNVHVVTKADLKPVDSATKVKAISIFEPTFHVRGSMARIENINSDELPIISKFKQNGNQVSFRIEIPKSETTKKQKFDIQYTLPTEM